MHRTAGHPLIEVLAHHKTLVEPNLGLAKSTQATLYVEPNCFPWFCKDRSVPYALHEKVQNEFDQLQPEKIIDPVQFSSWEAPTVAVLKQDDSVTIGGDY